MGLPSLTKRDAAHLCSSPPLSCRVSKVASKPYDVLTKAAFQKKATALLAAAAKYASVSYGSYSFAKSTKSTSEPIRSNDITLITMAQIYSDIDTAWLSGMANLTVDTGDRMNVDGGVENTVQECLISSVNLAKASVFKVLEYASLWLRDGKQETSKDPSTNSIFFPFSNTAKCTRTTSLPEKLAQNYASASSAHGWVILSILAHSEAFRNAARNFEEADWDRLMNHVAKNKISLQLFFEVRGLDWETPLRQIEDIISPNVVASYIEQEHAVKLPLVCFEKPHSYVVPANDHDAISRPQYKGQLQLDIRENIHSTYEFSQDPSIRAAFDGTCYICGYLSCDCDPERTASIIHPLVELIHCPGKGIGVRTLQSIKQGDCLDEYIGHLRPAASVTDQTYALELERPNSIRAGNLTIIDAQIHGNWTRYINASCEPSLKFVPVAIGSRCRMAVFAARDVSAFEELTIDYGDRYWLEDDARMCECSELNCRYSNEEKKEQLKIIAGKPLDLMDIDEEDETMLDC